MIKVVNRKRGETGEYVGRPSPLGNQFVIGRDGTREEVIRLYRTWLWNQMLVRANPPRARREILHLRKELEIMGELTLVCWCAPEPCHADVIAEAIEEWTDEYIHDYEKEMGYI